MIDIVSPATYSPAMMKQYSSILCVATAALVFFGPATRGDARTQRVLLSITFATANKENDLSVIKIDTWGVDFLAVCKIPSDWEIKVQKYADPAGSLIISRDYQSGRIDRLDKFFLVDVYDYHPLARGREHPPSFSGWAEFGGYKYDRGKRHILKAESFHSTPATNCPSFAPTAP